MRQRQRKHVRTTERQRESDAAKQDRNEEEIRNDKAGKKRHNALHKEMIKTLDNWDDLRVSRSGRDTNKDEEEQMNKREAAIKRSEKLEDTIWYRNAQRWRIELNDGRKRKRMTRSQEKRAWEARLSHGGVKGMEQRRSGGWKIAHRRLQETH